MREDGWGEVKAPGELGSLGLEADWQGCRLVGALPAMCLP